ncbi:homocysteine-responsive endoplasmic reticulum-resident ubiquitin-like domain member 2 protein [Colossoma macropomum]|uniref:homocysteine-responsive endoplasmic reticulum-resident ubiquitin-like domain member 2 protein n=1 Tax=Colossoma macropomum TaxID=42526 RepID=UPI001864A2C1|nr:homocysteine-responsive endoplasmic reticulum-resident ubiquitin-like domain member 2 protein [Colossoma macropomum]
MEQGVVDSPVILVIKAPDQKYDDQTINCFLNWTVEKLKTHLSKVYPSKPRSKDQRLVYSGKLLQDHCKLRDVLRKQDEFHMLHLVCASRSPPPSPTAHRRNSSKSPTVNADNSGGVTPVGNVQSASSEETPNRLSQNSGAVPNHPSTYGYAWGQWLDQHGPNARMPHYPMYNPMTLLWWQQLYAWNYHMSYQAWASSLRPSQQSASPSVSPPREGWEPVRENPQNAPAGEGQNEEDLNRDWLDWVYTASRALILLSIVYFYSSFSRFVMVTGGMLLLYLHQAGWLPFNLENELQDLADPANHDELNAENQNDLQDMERLADEGEEDDEQRGEGTDDAERGMNMGFFSSAWSFITTFFASLIPEGIPNAVN